MSSRLIKPVKDNMDKYDTYRVQKGRYNQAIKSGFYFEAMIIVYGIMEDRLRSFLYHSGALANKGSHKITANRTRPDIKRIVSMYKNDKESDSLGITNISGKLKITRALLRWASETTEPVDNDKYLRVLKSQYESLDIGCFLETISNIEFWCKYRNEVIHALMNKNLGSLQEDLKEKVEEGMEYALFLDSQVRIIKKGNAIRKAANLSLN